MTNNTMTQTSKTANIIFHYDLTEQEAIDCKTFAASIDVDYYAKRSKQFNEQRCRNQQLRGKVAEYAVAAYLAASKKWLCTSPDLSILPPSQKTYKPDLEASTTSGAIKTIAVKTIGYEGAVKYSPSWIFQKNDKHIYSPTHNDLIAFCVSSPDNLSTDICRILKVENIQKLFKPTKANFPDKQAIYLSDLPPLKILTRK